MTIGSVRFVISVAGKPSAMSSGMPIVKDLCEALNIAAQATPRGIPACEAKARKVPWEPALRAKGRVGEIERGR